MEGDRFSWMEVEWLGHWFELRLTARGPDTYDVEVFNSAGDLVAEDLMYCE
jgi:hypothetical protein